VDAWGRQAEVLAQYMKKGRPLLVEGRLKLDQWDDKQTGQKRSRLGVRLENFSFVDSKGDGGGAGSDAPRARPAAAGSSAPPAAESDGPPPEEDDVPF